MNLAEMDAEGFDRLLEERRTNLSRLVDRRDRGAVVAHGRALQALRAHMEASETARAQPGSSPARRLPRLTSTLALIAQEVVAAAAAPEQDVSPTGAPASAAEAVTADDEALRAYRRTSAALDAEDHPVPDREGGKAEGEERALARVGHPSTVPPRPPRHGLPRMARSQARSPARDVAPEEFTVRYSLLPPAVVSSAAAEYEHRKRQRAARAKGRAYAGKDIDEVGPAAVLPAVQGPRTRRYW